MSLVCFAAVALALAFFTGFALSPSVRSLVDISVGAPRLDPLAAAPTLPDQPPHGESRLDISSYQSTPEDNAFLRLVGRPSVDAVWHRRMQLAAPGAWLTSASPATSATPDIAAYARTDQPVREPAAFAVIDTVRAPSAGIAVPVPQHPAVSPIIPGNVPATTGEDDEEDDEEEAAPYIPRPLPRPSLAIATESANRSTPSLTRPDARLGASNKASDPAGVRQALAPIPLTKPAPSAPTAPPSAERDYEEISSSENQNYIQRETRPREVRLASLSPAPPAAPPASAGPAGPTLAPPPNLTIRTPFGIPYALQQESVEASCFPPPLVDLIHRIGQRYGQTPIVTSGLRNRGRRGSLHRRCQAADLMIPGVSASELARVAREVPGMGGVGQYCHPNLIHIDIGTARDWKQGCGGYFALRDGTEKPR
jgi:hypothetical protein